MGYRLKRNCNCLPCGPLEWPTGTLHIYDRSDTEMFIAGTTGIMNIPNWAIQNGRFSGFAVNGEIDDFGTIAGMSFQNNRDCGDPRWAGRITRWSEINPLAKQPILQYTIEPSSNPGYSNLMINYTATSTENCGLPTLVDATVNWFFTGDASLLN